VPPRIIVLVGLPGSGKSTYVKTHGLPALSSDAVRLLLADNETDQTIHGRVFATLRYLLCQRIAIGRPVTYVDATHLTPSERKPYLVIGERLGCQVEALFFDVPLDVCKQRNRLRPRIVPGEAIDAMAARMVRPSRTEGFSHVWVISSRAASPASPTAPPAPGPEAR
jgi:predicted kinase